jgi:hypothetical protein
VLQSGSLVTAAGCAERPAGDFGKAGESCAEGTGAISKPITDFSRLEACCQDQGGEAYCLKSALVPDKLRDKLAACSGDRLCVPRAFLENDGSKPIPACTAFGRGGVCLSRCIPEVADKASHLRKDSCSGADDLCAPLNDPLTGQPTEAQDLVDSSCDQEVSSCNRPVQVLDPAIFPKCADNASCVEDELIGTLQPDAVDKLAKCDNVPGTRCTPNSFFVTGGDFLLKTCTSTNGAEGRCAPLLLPDVKASDGFSPQADCPADSRCVACLSPVDGTKTGMCDLGCDVGATQPAKLLAQCGAGNAGRCVLASTLSTKTQGILSVNNCAAANVLGQAGKAYLCVPVQNLKKGPFAKCQETLPGGGGPSAGTCLDGDILVLPHRNLLQDAGCSAQLGAGFVCTPCVTGSAANNPTSGTPTGAPGCKELYPEIPDPPGG